MTPIKGKNGGEKSAGEPPGDQNPPEPPIELQFRGGGDDEPGSLRVWQALRAVCSAAEEAGVQGREEEYIGLATAAAILSDVLEARVEVGRARWVD